MISTQWEPRLTLPVSPERDHLLGPPDAPVTLVEYGDYECRYCGAAYPEVNEVRRQMGDRLCFVFRHFPITTAHPHAQQAAEAAECAGGQGRFWEMHDTLFEHQPRLNGRDLLRFAEAIGLDLDRFASDMMRHVYADRVREDFMSGVRSGVNGTPTFFINGLRHDDSFDAPTLLAALEWSRTYSGAR